MVSNLMAGYFHFLTSHFAVPHGGNSIVGYYHLESTASKKTLTLNKLSIFLHKKMRTMFAFRGERGRLDSFFAENRVHFNFRFGEGIK